MSRYLVLLTVMLFTGCTIVPDSIDVPEGTQLVSYSKAVTSSANAQGQKARWGGMIVGVENKPNKTFIELAHFPLNHYGKPSTNGETSGRFKVAKLPSRNSGASNSGTKSTGQPLRANKQK